MDQDNLRSQVNVECAWYNHCPPDDESGWPQCVCGQIEQEDIAV